MTPEGEVSVEQKNALRKWARENGREIGDEAFDLGFTVHIMGRNSEPLLIFDRYRNPDGGYVITSQKISTRIAKEQGIRLTKQRRRATSS